MNALLKFIDYHYSHYCLLSRNGGCHDCDVKLRNLGCAQSYTTWHHNHGRLKFPLVILSQKSDPTLCSSHFSQVRGQDFQKDKCVSGQTSWIDWVIVVVIVVVVVLVVLVVLVYNVNRGFGHLFLIPNVVWYWNQP